MELEKSGSLTSVSAAVAKCDPTDGSPPGASVAGILTTKQQ